MFINKVVVFIKANVDCLVLESFMVGQVFGLNHSRFWHLAFVVGSGVLTLINGVNGILKIIFIGDV